MACPLLSWSNPNPYSFDLVGDPDIWAESRQFDKRLHAFHSGGMNLVSSLAIYLSDFFFSSYRPNNSKWHGTKSRGKRNCRGSWKKEGGSGFGWLAV